MRRRLFSPEDPDGRPADEIADPAHAGPAEATDDPADTRPAPDVEQHPGELPPELPDPPA